MLEKIKKSFRSASSKNGSYSVGMIALVICMVIVVNLIAGQLPENVKSIDISDNNIYGVSKTSKKVLNKLDKKVTFKIYAEKDSTDTRIKSFIKKYTALSDKISVKWIDPVLHPAALTKAGVDKNTIVISCKDTGKTKSVSFDDILENEDILNWILTTFDASSVEIRHNFTAITPSPSPLHGYHFYPHKTSGEGLFMGVIQKNDGTPFTMKKEKRATPSPAVKLPVDILPLLPDMTKYTPYIAGETLGILPKQHAEFIQYLSSKAGVIYKGCEIGECIKGKTKPAHALALYHKLQQKHVIRQEVDLSTALQFLRKEDIRFEAPQGEWILITYKGIGLGWVKEVGNRVNNYYPKEWRIKKL